MARTITSAHAARIKENGIDYKNVEQLKHYIMETKRILSRRVTKISARDQRKIALAIRHARHLAMLAVCDQHE